MAEIVFFFLHCALPYLSSRQRSGATDCTRHGPSSFFTPLTLGYAAPSSPTVHPCRLFLPVPWLSSPRPLLLSFKGRIATWRCRTEAVLPLSPHPAIVSSLRRLSTMFPLVEFFPRQRVKQKEHLGHFPSFSDLATDLDIGRTFFLSDFQSSPLI